MLALIPSESVVPRDHPVRRLKQLLELLDQVLHDLSPLFCATGRRSQIIGQPRTNRRGLGMLRFQLQHLHIMRPRPGRLLKLLRVKIRQ